MQEESITIINKLGLHARAAGKLVETTSRFSCDITIEKDSRNDDARRWKRNEHSNQNQWRR
jgi:phosphocarrier protein